MLTLIRFYCCKFMSSFHLTDPKEALGCDPSLFLAQYPQLYSGKSKIGCPVFISKPGLLNVDTIECITTMDGILNFHWYGMYRIYKGGKVVEVL